MERKIIYIILGVLLVIAGILVLLNPTIKKHTIKFPDKEITVEIKLRDYIKPYLKYEVKYTFISVSSEDPFYTKLMRLKSLINQKIKKEEVKKLYDKFRREYNSLQVCIEVYENVAKCILYYLFENEVEATLILSYSAPTIVMEERILDQIIKYIEEDKYSEAFVTILEAYKINAVKFYNTNIIEFISAFGN